MFGKDPAHSANVYQPPHRRGGGGMTTLAPESRPSSPSPGSLCGVPELPSRPRSPANFAGIVPEAKFSKKVFVGGLPPDIDADDLTTSFGLFGRCWVDWPHKAESTNRFPPKGYAFIVFETEMGVRRLLESCGCLPSEQGKLYIQLSSPSVRKKMVQVRPWVLADSEYTADAGATVDPRKTVFVGGVPRPLRAEELGKIFNDQFGGVCYAGIDTDADLRYPKGAGRVAFSNIQSYLAAISARFVFIQHPEASKRVEVKPYVLDDQICDECCGVGGGGPSPAPYFCPWVTCLQYYCHDCWVVVHKPGKGNRDQHKPLVKEPGLSGEFQRIDTIGGAGALGGILRGNSSMPIAPRRLPHVRTANISPSTGRPISNTAVYRSGARSGYRMGAQGFQRSESPRKLSSGSLLGKWSASVAATAAVGEERGRRNWPATRRGLSPMRMTQRSAARHPAPHAVAAARRNFADNLPASFWTGMPLTEFSPFADYMGLPGLGSLTPVWDPRQ